MNKHGNPEGFDKVDWAKVLLDSMVKELKTNKNKDFDNDSYSGIRDEVTTSAHQWTWTHTS